MFCVVVGRQCDMDVLETFLRDKGNGGDGMAAVAAVVAIAAAT